MTRSSWPSQIGMEVKSSPSLAGRGIPAPLASRSLRRKTNSNERLTRTSCPHPWTVRFLGVARNDGCKVCAEIPNRHLDRSEAQWRDMTVAACGYDFGAIRSLTKGLRGHRPHTPERSYFSALLEMTVGVAAQSGHSSANHSQIWYLDFSKSRVC